MSDDSAKSLIPDLTEHQVKILGDIAKYTGISREKMIRLAVKIGLQQLRHCLSEEANQQPHDCEVVSGFIRHLGEKK